MFLRHVFNLDKYYKSSLLKLIIDFSSCYTVNHTHTTLKIDMLKYNNKSRYTDFVLLLYVIFEDIQPELFRQNAI